jgi:hypothetical protein
MIRIVHRVITVQEFLDTVRDVQSLSDLRKINIFFHVRILETFEPERSSLTIQSEFLRCFFITINSSVKIINIKILD